MALDGPYTIDDLLAMTGRRRKPLPVLLADAPRQPAALRRKTLRLLGIDPGTRCVGWGVIECRLSDRRLKLLDCGCIRPSLKLDLKERLCEIFSELEEIIQRARPDAAALEETFAGVNMRSAIAMGEGRGIALLALARAKLHVLELAPRSIKHAVTGSGAAGKAHVAALVASQLDLPRPPRPEDITDALAAAIALARRV